MIQISLSLYQEGVPVLEKDSIFVQAVPRVGESVIWEAEDTAAWSPIAGIYEVTDITHCLGGAKNEAPVIRVTCRSSEGTSK
jgi:hypothetical protein